MCLVCPTSHGFKKRTRTSQPSAVCLRRNGNDWCLFIYVEIALSLRPGSWTSIYHCERCVKTANRKVSCLTLLSETETSSMAQHYWLMHHTQNTNTDIKRIFAVSCSLFTQWGHGRIIINYVDISTPIRTSLSWAFQANFLSNLKNEWLNISIGFSAEKLSDAFKFNQKTTAKLYIRKIIHAWFHQATKFSQGDTMQCEH